MRLSTLTNNRDTVRYLWCSTMIFALLLVDGNICYVVTEWVTCSKPLDTFGGDRDATLTDTSTVTGATLSVGVTLLAGVTMLPGVTLLACVALLTGAVVLILSTADAEGFWTTITFRRIPPPSLNIIRPPPPSQTKHSHCYRVIKRTS